jgi:hypothetical protein
VRPEFPKTIRNPKHFWREIEKLRQERLIENTEYRRKNRHNADQIVLTTEGLRRCVDI